jgi:hypothetical protein
MIFPAVTFDRHHGAGALGPNDPVPAGGIVFGSDVGMSLPFWDLADIVEELRRSGLSTERIAAQVSRTPAQVVGVEIIAGKVRDELERLVRC